MNMATNKLPTKCFSICLKLIKLFKQRYQQCFYIERIDSSIILEYLTRKVKPKSKYWFYLGLILKDNISKYGLGPLSTVSRDKKSLPLRMANGVL